MYLLFPIFIIPDKSRKTVQSFCSFIYFVPYFLRRITPKVVDGLGQRDNTSGPGEGS